MNKILNLQKGLLMTALLAFISLGFTACSDSDGGGGQPEITGVRVCDPELADSLFQKSAQGQVIAIIGHNLGSATAVYINDQKVGFSTTMNTDHSIIVTVPSEKDGFELTAFNSNLKDEIRVETTHGTATYAFKILGAAPVLQRIQGSYPRKAGDVLNVYGLNLYSIENIYFTDASAEELAETTWETVPGNHVAVSDYKIVSQERYLNSYQNYEVASQLQLTTPDIPYSEGSLVIECSAGIVYIPYYKLPGKPVITFINTDMPIPGTDLVIKGREFVQVESVSFGDVTLGPNDFTVAESEDEITISFTSEMKPTIGTGSSLKVTTPGGSATYDYFYVYDGLMLNFEDGYAIDNGWGPNGETMNPATSASLPFVTDGKFFRIKASDGGWNWWNTMCFFRYSWDGGSFVLPGTDLIPASASLDDVYLAMEVWDNNTDFGMNQKPFLAYQLWSVANTTIVKPNGDQEEPDPDITFMNFIQNDAAYKEIALRAIDNSQPKEQWYRHVVPLSNFDGWSGKTYGDVLSDGIRMIRLMHMNWTGTPSSIDIMFDNVRILYVPSSK